MNLKAIKSKEFLHDGNEEIFYRKQIIEFKGQNIIEFKVSDLKKLNELEKNWTESDFEKLINQFNGIISKSDSIPEIVTFKNENGLAVYFKETEKYLAILSLGEKQPMRYQIFLETLFEK